MIKFHQQSSGKVSVFATEKLQRTRKQATGSTKHCTTLSAMGKIRKSSRDMALSMP